MNENLKVKMSNTKNQLISWKEERRIHAVELKNKGWKQKEIATALSVSGGAVSLWLKTYQLQGKEGLHARSHTGRPPKLTNSEKRQILNFLLQGTEAYGFRGDLWTSQRIGKVIEREFEVKYHRSHIARLLKELQWTPQRPTKHFSQRNQDEIDYWIKNVWEENVISASKELRSTK
jgi:transposase